MTDRVIKKHTNPAQETTLPYPQSHTDSDTGGSEGLPVPSAPGGAISLHSYINAMADIEEDSARLETVAKSGHQKDGTTEQDHPPKGALAFRLRGVPVDWDTSRLQSFLAEQYHSAGPTVQSLATEVRGRSRTATVSFRKKPHVGHTWKIPLPTAPTQFNPRQDLEFDDGFGGITTVHAPPSQHHKVE